jgi:hypothetical protein
MELLIVWLGCAVASTLIGARKGADGIGCLLGALLGPVGIIITACLPGDRLECPYCREPVRKGATVCPHCQKAIRTL